MNLERELSETHQSLAETQKSFIRANQSSDQAQRKLAQMKQCLGHVQRSFSQSRANEKKAWEEASRMKQRLEELQQSLSQSEDVKKKASEEIGRMKQYLGQLQRSLAQSQAREKKALEEASQVKNDLKNLKWDFENYKQSNGGAHSYSFASRPGNKPSNVTRAQGSLQVPSTPSSNIPNSAAFDQRTLQKNSSSVAACGYYRTEKPPSPSPSLSRRLSNTLQPDSANGVRGDLQGNTHAVDHRKKQLSTHLPPPLPSSFSVKPPRPMQDIRERSGSHVQSIPAQHSLQYSNHLNISNASSTLPQPSPSNSIQAKHRSGGDPPHLNGAQQIRHQNANLVPNHQGVKRPRTQDCVDPCQRIRKEILQMTPASTVTSNGRSDFSFSSSETPSNYRSSTHGTTYQHRKYGISAETNSPFRKFKTLANESLRR